MTVGEPTSTEPPDKAARFRNVASAGVWAVADQGVSSISNLALAVVIARVSTPREFGAFSLAFSGYGLWVGLSRWVGGTIFVMRFASLPRHEQRPHYRALTGVGLCVSVLGSVVFLLSALIVGGPIVSFFLITAILLPGLVMQDDWRQLMFAMRNSRAAFFCDLLWLALEVPMLVAAWAITGGSPDGYLVAWGLGALGATLAFAVAYRTAPSIRAAKRFLRDNARLVPGLLGEYLALSGTQILPYGIAAVLGLSTVGGLRAAQVVFGLAASPLMGLVPLVMVYCVRRYNAGGIRSLHRLQTALTVPGCAWVALFTLCVQFLPSHLGRLLTGASWNEGRHVLVALGVVYVAQWMSTVDLIALRTTGRVKRVAVIRTILTTLTFAGALGLGAVAGLSGAVWGMAIAAVIGALLAAVVSRITPGQDRSDALAATTV